MKDNISIGLSFKHPTYRLSFTSSLGPFLHSSSLKTVPRSLQEGSFFAQGVLGVLH